MESIGNDCGTYYICDNSDDPEEMSRLQAAVDGFPVRILDARSNAGFGSGVNYAAQAAIGDGAESLLITNPDTVWSSEALSTLLEVHASCPDGIVSPVMISQGTGGNHVWYAGGTIDPTTLRVDHNDFGRSVDVLKELPEVVPTAFITGAAFMISSERWTQLGGFRSDLFMYYEDVELSLRARERAVPMLVAARSSIIHDEGGTHHGGSNRRLYDYFEPRNRLIVAAVSGKAIGSLGERGFLKFWRFTLQLALRPLRRGSGNRLISVTRRIRGTLAGLMWCRRTRGSRRSIDGDQSVASTRLVQYVTQLEPAGAQRVALWIADTLKAEVHVDTCFLYKKHDVRDAAGHTVLLPCRPRNLREVARLLTRLRRTHSEHDLIIAHTHYSIALAVLIELSLFRTRRTLAVHHWPIKRYPFGARLVHTIGRKMNVFAGEVGVARGLDESADLIEILNPVPNPVPKGPRTRAVDLLVVARHAREKRLDTVVRAMALLPGRHVTLVGTGPLTDELRDLARREGVDDRVDFAGALDHDDVLNLMAWCRVLIQASEWEAMPMTILEGVAQDARLVVSDIPAHAFAIEAGAASGFRLGNAEDLAAAITTVERPKTEKALGSGRRALAERLSEPKQSGRWHTVISEAISG